MLAEELHVGIIGIAGFATETVVVVGNLQDVVIDELRHGMEQADAVRPAGDGEKDGAVDFVLVQKALQVINDMMWRG